MDLNTALANYPQLPIDAVEAYGMETAPLVDYAKYSKKISTEYIIRSGGKKRRVYSWLNRDGASAMYVFFHGVMTFLSEEVETMLTYGEPQYDRLTPVATSATVLS